MGDDMFGRADMPGVVDDFDQYHNDDGTQQVNEEDEEKRRLKERAEKKETFMKRYLLEKQWYKEEQLRLEEQRRKEEAMMKKRMQQFTLSDQKSILEKYEYEDSIDEFNKPITQYKGPTNDRIVTNKNYLYLWAFLNAFFLATAIYVLLDGRPVRLRNGYDFRTEMCGSGKYVDAPYLYYANPVKDIRVAFCIKECPTSSGPLICLYDTTGKAYETTYEKFCYVQMQGKLRGKYCRPKEPKNQVVVDNYLESFDLSVKRYASDLFMSVEALIVGVIFTIGFSFLFSVLIKKDNAVTYFVMSIFFTITLCFQILAYMFYREYLLDLDENCFTLKDEKGCVGNRGYSYRILAIVILVFGVVYIIVLSVLSKRIYKIIGFLKIATQIVSILEQIKLLPFYILGLAIIISCLSLITIPFGLSVANVVTQTSVEGAITGEQLKVMIFSKFAYFIAMYDFYLFIVWMIFLLGFRDFFISYSLSIWFFTKKKETVNIPKWAIFKNIFRYHVGSIVMYSLISTVITIPKILIQVVRKSLRALPQYMNSVRYFQATCNTCLFSYEKFLRYFSKNSLVQISITSKDFYPCSKMAYFLLFRNTDKVSDIDKMQEFVVNNIKYCCAFLCGIISYIFLSFVPTTPLLGYDTKEIENKIIAGMAMFVFAYFFSSIFQGSYDILCKTVIQSYLIDEEIFYGENRYVEPFIKNVFEYYVKEDIDKYKIQSKDGVLYDQEKAAKAKQEESDDDKSFNSEESDKSLEAKEIKPKKEPKEDKTFKPNQTSNTLKPPPATVAPPRLPTQSKEIELSDVNISQQLDDSVLVKPQPLVSERVLPSPKLPPQPVPRYPTKNVGMKDYPTANSKNNTSTFVPKPQTPPVIIKPPTPLPGYARPTASSNGGFPLKNNNQNNQKTITINNNTQQKIPLIMGQYDDDQEDDFSLNNPFEKGPFQQKTQLRPNQNAIINRAPNRNEVRLLNFQPNRLQTGQSNSSKQKSKEPLDPFSQFDKEINLDSDGNEIDDD